MLINLVSIHPAPSPQSIPLANAFLKAYALKSAVTVTLSDFFLGDDYVVCAARLAASQPTAIGFSMYVWNRDFISQLAAVLRLIHPAVILFCGGPEVSAAPESVANSMSFDFIIVGEGETPFLQFCQALAAGTDYANIPGILLPGAAATPAPKPLTDLDSIPSPYLTGVINTHANPGLLWQLSRGCSFTCDFCFDARGIHGVRQFSLERLEAELKHFAASDVAQVFVLDSTFNLDAKRAKKILRLIKRIAPQIHFHFEVRNEFIDKEMAKLFAEIACSLQIGLQSANREVLRIVGRSIDKADFTAKVGLLNDSGAVFGFDLIYGLPGDTLKGFKNTLDYALSLYPNHLDIFPLAVLPGTRLAAKAAALNMHWEHKPPYIVDYTASFTAADMAVAARLAAACDIFYTRGKMVAWFNAIVAVTGLKPADLLQKFSNWLLDLKGVDIQESDLTDDDIWDLQQDFLKQLFSSKKLKRYLSLMLDLANYHHEYAEVLLAPMSAISSDSTLPASLCDTGFTLAPAARIAHFTYDIDELLDYGEPQLVRMYEHLQPSGSQAVVYNNGMICTESLAAPYILLLEQIRDGRSHDHAADSALSRAEADEFLLFALKEGIILKTD